MTPAARTTLVAALAASLAAPGVARAQDAAADPFATTLPSAATQPATDPFADAPSTAATTPVDPADVGYDAATNTVEIHVSNADLVEVLRMLSMQMQRNIIASDKVTGTVTANLYNVSTREALEALLFSKGYGYREQGNFIYVYGRDELRQQEEATRRRETRVFRLHYLPGTEATRMLAGVVSEGAKIESSSPAEAGGLGGETTYGASTATLDALVITDFPDKLDAVAKVLAELDVRPQQVLVEATILIARLEDNTSLGIDFTLLGGVDFSTLNGPGAGAPGLAGALNGTTINSPNGSAVADRGYVAGQAGGGGLKLGLVKNDVGVFVEALERTADTTVLSNPKVLVLNKQSAVVRVGQEIGYRDQVTVAAENGAVQGSVAFLQTGTTLAFRPFVGKDNDVRLEVMPEESSGSLVEDNLGKLPQKQTAKIVSNILVKDGHTVVIGGLFRENATVSRAQAPGLGSLPIVGPLFRRQSDFRGRDEVIILLTPHVLKDDAQYAKSSADAELCIDRLRFGVRRGMLPFGRGRLAEGSYEAARRELDQPGGGSPGRALWHLNRATALSPQFEEATRLRERLVGRRLTASDNTCIRTFVREQIERDRQRLAEETAAAPTSENGARPTTLPAATQPGAPAVTFVERTRVVGRRGPMQHVVSVVTALGAWTGADQIDFSLATLTEGTADAQP